MSNIDYKRGILRATRGASGSVIFWVFKHMLNYIFRIIHFFSFTLDDCQAVVYIKGNSTQEGIKMKTGIFIKIDSGILKIVDELLKGLDGGGRRKPIVVFKQAHFRPHHGGAHGRLWPIL